MTKDEIKKKAFWSGGIITAAFLGALGTQLFTNVKNNVHIPRRLEAVERMTIANSRKYDSLLKEHNKLKEKQWELSNDYQVTKSEAAAVKKSIDKTTSYVIDIYKIMLIKNTE